MPYILDEFQFFWETSYDVTDPNFKDCSISSPPGSNGDGLMYIMNHFLDKKLFFGALIPDTDALETTNNLDGSIKAEIATCHDQGHGDPNVILLDYFDKGMPCIIR